MLNCNMHMIMNVNFRQGISWGGGGILTIVTNRQNYEVKIKKKYFTNSVG